MTRLLLVAGAVNNLSRKLACTPVTLEVRLNASDSAAPRSRPCESSVKAGTCSRSSALCLFDSQQSNLPAEALIWCPMWPSRLKLTLVQEYPVILDRSSARNQVLVSI